MNSIKGKRNLFLILLTFFSIQLNAQVELGIIFGTKINFPSSILPKDPDVQLFSTKNNFSLPVGFQIDYQINNYLKISNRNLITLDKIIISNTEFFSSQFESDIRYTRIGSSVMIGVSPVKNIFFKGGAGFRFGDIENGFQNLPPYFIFQQTIDRYVTIGLEYNFLKKLSIEISYNHETSESLSVSETLLDGRVQYVDGVKIPNLSILIKYTFFTSKRN